MHTWLLLTYNIPAEPSARRVYIWRKLKRVGAILYQDAFWVLPANARTLEQFQWLAAEINEIGGESSLWKAGFVFAGEDEALVQRFADQVDRAYQEIQDMLRQIEPDLEALSRHYLQILSKDYFQSETGKLVRMALLAARGGEP